MTAKDGRSAPRELWITGNPEGDHLLSTHGNALLVGMTFDQRLRSSRRRAVEGTDALTLWA